MHYLWYTNVCNVLQVVLTFITRLNDITTTYNLLSHLLLYTELGNETYRYGENQIDVGRCRGSNRNLVPIKHTISGKIKHII
jgi:hypothetical protein